jgi:hypothetical protein
MDHVRRCHDEPDWFADRNADSLTSDDRRVPELEQPLFPGYPISVDPEVFSFP